MEIQVKAGSPYPIYIEEGALSQAGELFELNRKALIVTDNGVPKSYAETVAAACKEPYIEIFPAGEASKNLSTWQTLLERLSKEKFSRSDCVIAVGGGVTGDMAGFAAACYLRGIDFYNIPTTLLAQVDSSVGGKVAVDFMGYKNTVGAFYNPKGVLIDPKVLDTLEPRQIACGLAEATKMAATCDANFFQWLEENDPLKNRTETILRAITIKKEIVEADEKELGLRRVLNFGHTLGHAVESATSLFHGECVAIGMLPFTAAADRERLKSLLQRFQLPTEAGGQKEKILENIKMDKKITGNDITVVRVPQIGQYTLEKLSLEELIAQVKEAI